MTTALTHFMDSFFDDSIFFRNLSNRNSVFDNLFQIKHIDHPIAYRTDDKNVIFEIAATGADKKDINIEQVDDTIVVSYKNPKKDETKAFYTEENYKYNGICRKEFNLAFKIGEIYDIAKTDAKLDKGILSIIVPKKEEVKPKTNKISIK